MLVHLFRQEFKLWTGSLLQYWFLIWLILLLTPSRSVSHTQLVQIFRQQQKTVLIKVKSHAITCGTAPLVTPRLHWSAQGGLQLLLRLRLHLTCSSTHTHLFCINHQPENTSPRSSLGVSGASDLVGGLTPCFWICLCLLPLPCSTCFLTCVTLCDNLLTFWIYLGTHLPTV